MIRQVRGSGTLVPEEIRWIPATTQGRVERIILRPGAQVTAGTVILELSNPELQQSVKEAQLAHQSAQAAFQNRKAELESSLLSQQSNVAGIEAKYKNAMMTLEANEQLAKDELISAIALKQSRAAAEELKNQLAIEQKRLEMTQLGIKSQIAPQEADVNQRRAAYDLRLRQLEDLKVKSSMDGVLQLVPVEVGASVQPGANLARVANPTQPEGGAADRGNADQGHHASAYRRKSTRATASSRDVCRASTPRRPTGPSVWTSSSKAHCRPARGPTSASTARFASSCSTTSFYVGRPAFGQENSTVGLFKVGADGEATRVNGEARTQFGQHHRDHRRLAAGRSGDPLGHVELRRVFANQAIELQHESSWQAELLKEPR